MPQKPKASLQTLGCRLNQSETASIAQSLINKGYEIVSAKEPADLCVINTCTVTGQGDAKNRQAIRSAYRHNPNASIAVIGCYSQMEADTIRKMDGVRLIIGNEDKLNLAEYLDRVKDTGPPLVINPKIKKKNFEIAAFSFDPQKTRSHLKIQDGCDFMCSFCIIPFSRGRSRSRNFENILAEARSLVNSGIKEIVLTGVNLGTYQDDAHHFLEIIEELNKLSNLKRIRISSIEPTTVPEKLLDYMIDSQHKLVPFFHLPVQSVSNAILKDMKRRYTAEEYVNEINNAYAKVPDLCIGTDVMTGFPGETDKMFKETLAALTQLPLAYYHVFPFSERKGTPAEKRADKVSSPEKQYRSQVLRKLSAAKKWGFQEKFIGTCRKVLFEQNDTEGYFCGYTDNYIRVRIPAHSTEVLKNQIKKVHLVENHGNFIMGAFV